jgi:hypothetical protein
MKIDVASILAILLLLSLTGTIFGNDSISKTSSLRGRGGGGGASRALSTSDDCTLVYVETEMDLTDGSDVDANTDDEEETVLECELSPADAEVVGRIFVPVKGIPKHEQDKIKSGVTTLRAGGGLVMEGKLHVPSDASVEFGSIHNSTNPEHRRRQLSKQTGTNKVLVIRTIAQDSKSQDTVNILEDTIFGRFGNQVNLMSVYRDCSYGQMTIEPFRGETEEKVNVDYGVVEVQVNQRLVDEDRFDAENFVSEAAIKQLGDLRSQFDHVMICLPYGTTRDGAKNWLAYAYVNSWLSVYNDKWCSRVSTQVHGKFN